MPQPELDRLLINNLGDLEAAARHLQTELMPAIARALNEKLAEVIEENGWAGRTDYESDDFWLAPQEWHVEGANEEAFECWFGMDITDGEWAHVQYWLACLLGVGIKQLGMRWSRDITRRRLWRKQLSEQVEIISRLRARGFEFQEAQGSFFLPFRIESDALASAVADEAPELALAPFEDALRRCIEAKPDFDALLKATPQE